MKDFRSLKVWEKAHQAALTTYRITSTFPKDEIYGLSSQIRRAAISIPANIAEGCGRGSDTDFARFLQVTMGSASELECELLIARDLGFLLSTDHQLIEKEIQEIKQMLASLLKKLRGAS